MILATALFSVILAFALDAGANDHSGVFPCDLPPSQTRAPFRFVKHEATPVFDAPGGIKIAELSRMTTVRIGAADGDYIGVELSVWCSRRRVAGAAPDQVSDSVRVAKDSPLFENPTYASWGEGEYGVNGFKIGTLLKGGTFLQIGHTPENLRIRVHGWVPKYSLLVDPEGLVIPDICVDFTIEARGDSTRFTGTMQNPLPSWFVATFRLAAWNYCGERIGEKEFGAGGPAGPAPGHPVPFAVTLPVRREHVATYRLGRTLAMYR